MKYHVSGYISIQINQIAYVVIFYILSYYNDNNYMNINF